MIRRKKGGSMKKFMGNSVLHKSVAVCLTEALFGCPL